MSFRVLATGLALLFGLLLLGCGDESGPGVAQGRYRLLVEGAVTDTLTGPATLRPSASQGTGIELGSRDGPGLSMKLTSAQADEDSGGPRGRFRVVQPPLLDAPQLNGLSGLVAFLSLPDAHFVATQGHFSVAHAGDGLVEGTLNLEMQERGFSTSTPRTVRVTGTLRATSP